VIAQGRLVAQGTMAELRTLAQTGEHGTLEEIFLRTVGAADEQLLEGSERSLSWLE
jgi:hypothetical protein